jgi:hypothetical protein
LINKCVRKIKEQGKRITPLEQAHQTSSVEAINTPTPGGGGDDHDNDKMDEIVTKNAGRCPRVHVVEHTVCMSIVVLTTEQ